METRENVGVTEYHEDTKIHEDTKSRCTKDLRDFVFLRAFVKIRHTPRAKLLSAASRVAALTSGNVPSTYSNSSTLS